MVQEKDDTDSGLKRDNIFSYAWHKHIMLITAWRAQNLRLHKGNVESCCSIIYPRKINQGLQVHKLMDMLRGSFIPSAMLQRSEVMMDTLLLQPSSCHGSKKNQLEIKFAGVSNFCGWWHALLKSSEWSAFLSLNMQRRLSSVYSARHCPGNPVPHKTSQVLRPFLIRCAAVQK